MFVHIFKQTTAYLGGSPKKIYTGFSLSCYNVHFLQQRNINKHQQPPYISRFKDAMYFSLSFVAPKRAAATPTRVLRDSSDSSGALQDFDILPEAHLEKNTKSQAGWWLNMW